MKRSLSAGAALALTAAVAYGTAYALARPVYEAGGNSLTLVTLRYLILLPIIGALLAANRTSPRVPVRLTPPVVATGLAMFVTSGGNLSAVHFIPVSLAILVFYSYPLMILAIVCVLDRRAPRAAELAAFALTFCGIALALNAGLEALHPTGVALALAGAAGAATVLVVSERRLAELGAMHVTFVTAAVACLAAGALTVSANALAMPEGVAGAGALGAGMALFAIAIVSMFAAVRHIGPIKTSLALCLEPVVGIAAAVVLLGEPFTGRQAFGALLVVAGVAWVQAAKGAHAR